MLTFGGFNFLVLGGLAAVVLLLQLRKPGMFTWALVWWVVLYLGIHYGFEVPVPGSVAMLYMSIVTLCLAAYISSSPTRWAEFVRPLLRLMVEPRYKFLLVLIVVAVPALVAFNVYRDMTRPLQAPAFGRTVHPAPPETITVHDNEISLITGVNPYRHLEHDEPEAFDAHVDNGRRVYYENCFYCHGDAMAGDGMYAYGLNPIPTNFTDQGVLPNLQESFIFWRIAKGGPGLPEEGGPWDTAMPAWEEFLTEEEMWDVVLFLYEFNNYKPRAKGEH